MNSKKLLLATAMSFMFMAPQQVDAQSFWKKVGKAAENIGKSILEALKH